MTFASRSTRGGRLPRGPLLLTLAVLAGGAIEVLTPRTASAAPDAFDDRIAAAEAELQLKKYESALEHANAAVRERPDDFRGHYYVGFALLRLERFDEAQAAAERAVVKAPASGKAGAQRLADAVDSRRAFLERLRAGESAEATGLRAKAAREYAAAFALSPKEHEVAMKAAALYVDLRLPVEAALVLYDLLNAGPPEHVAKAAADLRGTLDDKLRELYRTELGAAEALVDKIGEQGWTATDEAKREILDRIRRAAACRLRNPSEPERAAEAAAVGRSVFFLKARCYAALGDRDGLAAAIAEAGRAGVLVDDAEAFGTEGTVARRQWLPLLKDAAFLELLGDAFGPAAVAAAKEAGGAGAEVRLPTGMRKATERGVYLWKTPAGVEIEMVYVPPGTFTMGSDDGKGDERPQHRHKLSRGAKGYWIGRYETTWREYLAFCDATGRARPHRPSWAADDHPVVNVDWTDATTFCAWAGLELPTEPMWERAARGTDGRKYPWGNEEPTPDRCVWNSHPTFGGKSTAPVGGRPAGVSPYGAHDMAGNVWEWCADGYDGSAYARYSSGSTTPPSSGPNRVGRGGSWDYSAEFLRAANRDWFAPSRRLGFLGFRPARVIP